MQNLPGDILDNVTYNKLVADCGFELVARVSGELGLDAGDATTADLTVRTGACCRKGYVCRRLNGCYLA